MLDNGHGAAKAFADSPVSEFTRPGSGCARLGWETCYGGGFAVTISVAPCGHTASQELDVDRPRARLYSSSCYNGSRPPVVGVAPVAILPGRPWPRRPRRAGDQRWSEEPQAYGASHEPPDWGFETRSRVGARALGVHRWIISVACWLPVWRQHWSRLHARSRSSITRSNTRRSHLTPVAADAHGRPHNRQRLRAASSGRGGGVRRGLRR